MEEANVDGEEGFQTVGTQLLTIPSNSKTLDCWQSTANHRLKFKDIGLLAINCLTVGSDLQIHRIHILQGSTGSTGARMKI